MLSSLAQEWCDGGVEGVLVAFNFAHSVLDAVHSRLEGVDQLVSCGVPVFGVHGRDEVLDQLGLILVLELKLTLFRTRQLNISPHLCDLLDDLVNPVDLSDNVFRIVGISEVNTVRELESSEL